ncbi:MAG: hypothetical protein MUP58_02195 [Candidatus Nanohaloarchaeota archaeon QJJ-9]|nr:hypothetical protein [Candidatus Nanohaloarchaeota archaeon QJJ-9]
MYIEEEVKRKRSVFEVEDWRQAYNEIKSVLENRFSFDRVKEDDFEHFQERGEVKSTIYCYKKLDENTNLQLVLSVKMKESEKSRAKVSLATKAIVVTEYPEDSWFHESAFYFALRSFWDKFVYGWARGKWKDEAEQTLIDVHSELRGFFGSEETRR